MLYPQFPPTLYRRTTESRYRYRYNKLIEKQKPALFEIKVGMKFKFYFITTNQPIFAVFSSLSYIINQIHTNMQADIQFIKIVSITECRHKYMYKSILTKSYNPNQALSSTAEVTHTNAFNLITSDKLQYLSIINTRVDFTRNSF